MMRLAMLIEWILIMTVAWILVNVGYAVVTMKNYKVEKGFFWLAYKIKSEFNNEEEKK